MSDTDGDSGTVTPELRIRQLEDRLSDETERLVKLYDAYEQQERDIVGLRAEIEVLEKEVIDKEIDREGLEQLLSEKDNRVRDLELDHAKATKRIEHLEPELEKMEEKYTREKDRLARVFEIAEELDGDLRLAVAEMKARDDWYVNHMQIFEDLNKAIKRPNLLHFDNYHGIYSLFLSFCAALSFNTRPLLITSAIAVTSLLIFTILVSVSFASISACTACNF